MTPKADCGVREGLRSHNIFFNLLFGCTCSHAPWNMHPVLCPQISTECSVHCALYMVNVSCVRCTFSCSLCTVQHCSWMHSIETICKDSSWVLRPQCRVHWCTSHHIWNTMFTAQCTVHSFESTFHNAQFTVHSAQFTVHNAHFTVHSAHITVHTSQCTHHSAHFTVDTPQCTHHSAHFTVHTSQCTLNSVLTGAGS